MVPRGMCKMNKKIKVTVLCLAYNQERFIRDCLDGFVMQKTKFPFEVLVHDDASTDGTAKIIREYAEKYPDIIKPILQTENQWSRGINIWKNHMWPRINGEYVAMCEGDDYWTDPHKLQKQVDFFESRPEYSVCFHPVRVTWDDKRKPDCIWSRSKKNTLELSDLLKRNFISTVGVMYRWRKECEQLFPDLILPGDWYLHMLHAQVGKIGYLPDIMAVYRRNNGGVWTGANKTDDWFIKTVIPHLNFYKCAMAQFNHNYTNEMSQLAAGGICAFFRAGQMDKIELIHNNYPEIWNNAIQRLNGIDVGQIQNKLTKYKHWFNRLLVICIILLLIVGIMVIMACIKS